MGKKGVGRYCELEGVKEVEILSKGLDFRKPEYRRGVFKRFYDFHIRYKAHPGAVYYVLPYLSRQLGMTKEQELYFAFLNGNTQNPITSYQIFKKFPELKNVGYEEFKKWFFDNWKSLEFDIDRRYQKKLLPEALKKYQKLQAFYKGQEDMWNSVISEDKKKSNFMNAWNFSKKNLLGFGRLSCFSFLEYLKIFNINIECDNMFFRDINGSLSHRNGLFLVLGRNDLMMWNNNPEFSGKYTEEQFRWLDEEAKLLLIECLEFSKNNGNPNLKDIGFFTLESTLCSYKGWHKPNRRYPNVYNDMFYNRIKNSEKKFPTINLNIFWNSRKENLPKYLRLEDCPKDPGLVSVKQNHYLETGEVIMMENDFPCFTNNFGKVSDGNHF